jgi:hypothetical protein
MIFSGYEKIHSGGEMKILFGDKNIFFEDEKLGKNPF